MNILLVAPMPPQPEAPGAIPLVLYAQLTGLMELGHSITLVTIAGPDPAELAALDRLQAMGINVQAVRRTEPHGIARLQRAWRWITTWLKGQWPWRTIWFWEPSIQNILDRLFAECTFDAVIIEDNSMGIYQYNTTAPTIFTEHEVRRPRPVNWHFGKVSQWPRWAFGELDWQRWPNYERNIWQKFDLIQVFTQRDANSIELLAVDLASRIRVNPFGIVLPAPLDRSLEQNGNLLFVGNFTHPPNVDSALWLGNKLMPILRTQSSVARLWLVGPMPPASVQNLACADIEVTGAVPEIEPYFARAAIVLAPIRIGGGMRMKVLQAMALGKAIVTTARGIDGLRINSQEPPVLIAEDAAEQASIAAHLLAFPAERATLGLAARTFVTENFSARAYALRTEHNCIEVRVRKKHSEI